MLGFMEKKRRVRSLREECASLAFRGTLTAAALGLVVVGGLLFVAPIAEAGLQRVYEGVDEDLRRTDGGPGDAVEWTGALGVFFGASEAVRGAGAVARGALVAVAALFASLPVVMLVLPLGHAKKPLLLLHLIVATALVAAGVVFGLVSAVSTIGPMYDADRIMEI